MEHLQITSNQKFPINIGNGINLGMWESLSIWTTGISTVRHLLVSTSVLRIAPRGVSKIPFIQLLRLKYQVHKPTLSFDPNPPALNFLHEQRSCDASPEGLVLDLSASFVWRDMGLFYKGFMRS